MILIPFAETITFLVIAMTIAGYGFSIISPAINSSISLKIDAGSQGMVMGVTRSAMTLARVAGPILAGALFASFGKDWPFYAGAIIMAAVFLLVSRRKPLLTPTRKPQPPLDQI